MANSNYNYVSSNSLEWTLVSSGDQAANGDLVFTSLSSSKDYMLLIANSYATNVDAYIVVGYFSTDNGSTYLSAYYNPRLERNSTQFYPVSGASAASMTFAMSTGAVSKHVITGLESGKYASMRSDILEAVGGGGTFTSRLGVTTAVDAVKFTFTGIGGAGRTA
jgi:hypothetical protein